MADVPKEFSVSYRICRQTYPCKHGVEVNGETEVWSGVEIVAALQRSGQAVPDHFEYVLQDPALVARVQKLMNKD